MAVSDTDFNILELPQGNGGGGGGEDVNIFSSTHSISTEKTGNGWDLNVNGDDSLRIYVKNFAELMEAIVLVGEKFVAGDKTNCVIQIMADIDMTSATIQDENTYKIGTTKIIDVANKTYKFGLYLIYTTIICDGKRRYLQTIFPDNGHLDTWSIECDKVIYENVVIGGSVNMYDTMHGTRTQSNTPVQFSDYLLKTTGNCDLRIYDCQISCCGANQNDPNSYNPLIKIGSGSNTPSIYHTRIEIINCQFIHGTDPSGDVWSHLNAPIVIYNEYKGNYQRVFVSKQLSKNVNTTESETGVPNIQFRTVTLTYKNPWQIETDGTCLISHELGDEYLILKSRISSNDFYIQGQPDFQPEGATFTYNWVSLVDVLKALLKTKNKLSQTEIEGIVSSGVGAQENKYLDGIGLGAVVRGLTSCHYLYFWGNPTSGFTISQSEFSDCVTKILRGDKVIPLLLLLDASLNSLCTFIPANMYPDSQTTIKFVYISYYPTMIGRFEVTASLVGSTSTIQFIQ